MVNATFVCILYEFVRFFLSRHLPYQKPAGICPDAGQTIHRTTCMAKKRKKNLHSDDACWNNDYFCGLKIQLKI